MQLLDNRLVGSAIRAHEQSASTACLSNLSVDPSENHSRGVARSASLTRSCLVNGSSAQQPECDRCRIHAICWFCLSTKIYPRLTWRREIGVTDAQLLGKRLVGGVAVLGGAAGGQPPCDGRCCRAARSRRAAADVGGAAAGGLGARLLPRPLAARWRRRSALYVRSAEIFRRITP